MSICLFLLRPFEFCRCGEHLNSDASFHSQPVANIYIYIYTLYYKYYIRILYYIYVYTHIYTVYVYMYVCLCIYVYMYIYIHVYVCASVSKCMCIRIPLAGWETLEIFWLNVRPEEKLERDVSKLRAKFEKNLSKEHDHLVDLVDLVAGLLQAINDRHLVG